MNKKLKELNKIYDIEYPNRDYIIYSIGNETYIIPKTIFPMNILTDNIRIYHLGLKIIDEKGRPTYNYAQSFGRHCRDNYIIVACKKFNKLLRKGYIEKDDIIEDKGVNKVKVLKIKLNNKIYPVGFVIKADNKYLLNILKHFEDLIKVSSGAGGI